MVSGPVKLTTAQAVSRLAPLQGWTLVEGRLHKRFEFDDFVAAMAFMTAAAFEAERLGHHPNWSNVYKIVEVTLWTHDIDGLSALDFQLAAAMDHRHRR